MVLLSYLMFEENSKETLKKIFPKLGAGEISVSTDTRTIKTGDVFIAIKGEHFDGHDFVATAVEKGAAYCVVREGFGFNVKEVDVGDRVEGVDVEKLIYAKDTVQALQEMARQYRVWLDQERASQGSTKLEVIGISGCNGKTTTKNFLATVLSQKFNSGAEGIEGVANIASIEKVAYTKGNLNNFIGLPLTILSLNLNHDFAVIELGSNHPGEIALLCDIAKPTHGITTSIGAAHIEFFKTLDAIADEEGAIALALPKNGLYVVPRQDQYSEYLLSKTSAQRIAVDAKHVECLGVDFLNIESRLGEIGINAPHIVMDALLVTVVAHKLGLNCEEILKGLKETKNDKGRFSVSEVKINRDSEEVRITIIDDTYNGNPDSVIAAIKAMKELFPIQRKFVVLGCLKELGEYTHRGYERIVDVCREYGIFNLILINIDDEFDTERDAEGVETNNLQITRVIDSQACAEYLKKTIEVNDVILCKGSHSAKTWEVIEGLSS